MSYLEQSTRYIAYDARLGGRYRYYRDAERAAAPPWAPATWATWTGSSTPTPSSCRCSPTGSGEQHPKDPDDSDFVYRQAIRAKAFDAAAGPAAGGPAVQRGHLRLGPGLRGAAAAHAGPPAARGPSLRRDDARRAAQGDPLVPPPGRPGRPGRGRGRAYLAERPARPWRRWPPACSGDRGPADGRRADVRLRRLRPRRRGKVLAAMLYPLVDLPEHQLAGAGRAHVRRRAGRACSGPTWASGPTAATSPGRAFERTAYRFDVLRRLRRLPRPAAPPDADHRVAAAHARTTATCAPRRSTRPAQRTPRRGHATARPTSTTRWPPPSREQAPYAVSTGLPGPLRHAVQRPGGHAPARAAHLRPQGHPVLPAHRPADAPADRRRRPATTPLAEMMRFVDHAEEAPSSNGSTPSAGPNATPGREATRPRPPPEDRSRPSIRRLDSCGYDVAWNRAEPEVHHAALLALGHYGLSPLLGRLVVLAAPAERAPLRRRGPHRGPGGVPGRHRGALRHHGP